MADRNIGRPWNSEEDDRLKQAIVVYGDNDNWKTIAQFVPGRTNKACRKRWLHSLSPSIKKSAWTPDEDQLLLDFYNIYPNKWSVIARHIPGRTDDACSKRYREALDPNLKKDEWTLDEDRKLLEAYAKLGGKWGIIGQELSRSGLGCRNRWRLLDRKRITAPPVEPPSQSPFSPPTSLNDPIPIPEQSHSSPWSPVASLDATPYWEDHLSPYHGNSPVILLNHLSTPQEGLIMSTALPPDDTPIIYSQNDPPPPFQYSSSSLSAALSDPRATRTLPSTATNTPQTQPASVIVSRETSPFNQPDSTPRSNRNAEDSDVCMNMDIPDAPIVEELLDSDSEATAAERMNAVPSVSSTSGHTRQFLEPRDRSNSAPVTHSESVLSPASFHSALSSTSSTPISFTPLTLSPTSSPGARNSVDLPSIGQSFTGSVLFSPHYRPVAHSRPKVSIPKKRPDAQGPVRLSASLQVTQDPSVLPYACGHERCWPPDAPKSSARYSTSRELTEHSKVEHDQRPGGDRPFRCALEGCGKSWKSINGLQYHLQISKSHFQQAISSTFSPKSYTDRAHEISTPDSSEKKKKMWSCPKPNCIKEYRQLSGLRYHLEHGHPEDIPVQLESVPPALARKVAEKLAKAR